MTAEEAMKKIFEILYPAQNPDAEWTSNEIEWIAEVVNLWKKGSS